MGTMAKPRELLADERLFGKHPSPTFRTNLPIDLPEVWAETAAAKVHNRFAYDVFTELRHTDRTLVWLSAETGLSEKHLSQILRGHQVLSVGHITRIVRALGQIELWPAPGRLEDLQP